MNERCLHAEGAGMCYHCAPWMFPDGSDASRRAYALWHIENNVPLPREWVRQNYSLVRELAQRAS